MQIEKDNLRIRKLEINTDPFLSEFERQIEILPPNLKFIKKYIYLNFLPKIDKLIDDLEKIKLTPNYEEKITKIKPQSVQKVGTIITCIDTFETHNIEHMKTSKLVYGTSNGSLAIYDYENGKILLEKSIGKNRIEFLSTVTVKYFDTYCSRIAVNLRADPNIHFYYYNHSFSVIVFEASINLKEGLQSDPNTSLSSLVSGIKFSKDSFFVAIQDWEGGLRVYKFSDIPREMNNTNNTTSFKDQAAVPKRESVMMLNFQQKSDKKNSVVENQNNPTNTNSSYSLPVFVTQIRYKEAENYTILNPPKKEEDTKNKKEPPKNLNQKQTVKPAAGKEIKPQNILPDEVVYNITPDIDENGNDFTPFQKYSKNNSFFTFVQKKFIFEEKQTGGFTSCLLTVGFYVAFYNTNEMKFISLYSHLTDNMKNSFKVIKTKGGGILSSEESMSLTTLMAKKEKEYINFIKSKLENFTTGLNQINSALKNPKNDKEGKDTKEPSQNTQNNLDLLTKSEIVFTTLFPITILCGQKLFNNQNNLLAIGMTDGSISIWDAELHIDKFFFQDQFSPIVSLSLDENYLVAGGLDGLVHVYDLIEGKSIHKCFHNPFNNYPIQSVKFCNFRFSLFFLSCQ
jgi:WD40 repeat protein